MDQIPRHEARNTKTARRKHRHYPRGSGERRGFMNKTPFAQE